MANMIMISIKGIMIYIFIFFLIFSSALRLSTFILAAGYTQLHYKIDLFSFCKLHYF